MENDNPLGRPATPHPLRIRAEFDARSRWLWIVKPILAIPHYVALIVLGVASLLLTIVAGVAVLFTGRYPSGIFDFNVGVLRWSWRVSYYSFPINGTDSYPPFTLAARPEFPADLELERPEHLTNWAVLVKWWLFALPQYLIVRGLRMASLPIMVIGAFGLLFTGTYPPGLFDVLVGFNRWQYRVSVYALLMHDQYPPFRLDQGGTEPLRMQEGAQEQTPPGIEPTSEED